MDTGRTHGADRRARIRGPPQDSWVRPRAMKRSRGQRYPDSSDTSASSSPRGRFARTGTLRLAGASVHPHLMACSRAAKQDSIFHIQTPGICSSFVISPVETLERRYMVTKADSAQFPPHWWTFKASISAVRCYRSSERSLDCREGGGLGKISKKW